METRPAENSAAQKWSSARHRLVVSVLLNSVDYGDHGVTHDEW